MANTRISKAFIIALLVVPFYFKPFYVSYNNLSLINSIYANTLKVIFLITVFSYIKRKKISKFIFWVSIYYIIKMVSTILNQGNIFSLITECYPILGICMFIEIWLERDYKKFLKGCSIVFFILTLISFITVIFKPYGFTDIYGKIYFQRGGNQMAPFCIITLIFGMIYSYIKRGKIWSSTTIILAFINTYIMIKVNSSSGILAWLIIILYLIIPLSQKATRILNIKTYYIFYSIFFISIVMFKIQYKFSYIIENILDKNITFTGRTELWDIALKMIRNSPIIGYGAGDSTNIIYSPSHGDYLSSHNQIIQLILESGILGLIIFLTILHIVGYKLMRYRKNDISGLLSVSILSICISLFSEAMGFFDLFLILCLSYNVNKILKGDEKIDTKSDSLLLVR